MIAATADGDRLDDDDNSDFDQLHDDDNSDYIKD